MHEIKLVEASKIRPPRLTLGDVASTACKASLEGFRRNTERVRRMMQAPTFAAFTADRHRAALDSAFMELFGTIEPELERVRSDLRFGPTLANNLKRQLNIPKHLQPEILEKVLENVESFIKDFHGSDIGEVYESLLKAMLIQTWTCLEILFEDLWERALNEHPHDLSQVKLPDRAKRLDVSEIQEAGFDLSRQMGTLLKTRYHWAALADIRLAYLTAFSTNAGSVASALSDQNIDALFHLRNLVAHNSGIVDAHFLEETKTVKTLIDIRSLGENASIQFNGSLIRSRVDSALECGCAIIEAVDGWLSANSTNK